MANLHDEEKSNVYGQKSDEYEHQPNYDPKAGDGVIAVPQHEVDQRALRRGELKCDLILVPLVTAFYLLSFIDRANIGMQGHTHCAHPESHSLTQVMLASVQQGFRPSLG
jgi:hypothetical protein